MHSVQRLVKSTLMALVVTVVCCSIFNVRAVWAISAIDPATQAGFAAHKALYDIKLSGTKSGSQIVNITGQMFYEWQPSCDAWISNHRFNLNYEYADTPAMRITSDFSIYEPFDGRNMSFNSQRKRNGYVFEELRGQASAAQEVSEIGEALFTKPVDLRYDLPSGGVFPMAHSLGLLEHIRANKKFYNTVIFDGSDKDGPVDVNAFIGRALDPKLHLVFAPGVDAGLMGSPAHNVRLAFFPVADQSPTADYEMSLVFHENGIISDMEIEYDNFSVTQKLVALEPLSSSCEGGSAPEEQEN